MSFMLILLTVSLLRLLLPLTVLRWPLLGVALTLGADLADYHVFQMFFPIDFAAYSRWDKMLDLYYLMLFWFATWNWKSKNARTLSNVLFSYRTIGVALFLATGSTPLLFYFPNFFENFFIIYTVFLTIFNLDLFKTKRFAYVLFLFALLPKFIQEYIMHNSNIEFWKWLE